MQIQQHMTTQIETVKSRRNRARVKSGERNGPGNSSAAAALSLWHYAVKYYLARARATAVAEMMLLNISRAHRGERWQRRDWRLSSPPPIATCEWQLDVTARLSSNFFSWLSGIWGRTCGELEAVSTTFFKVEILVQTYASLPQDVSSAVWQILVTERSNATFFLDCLCAFGTVDCLIFCRATIKLASLIDKSFLQIR